MNKGPLKWGDQVDILGPEASSYLGSKGWFMGKENVERRGGCYTLCYVRTG